MSDDVGEPDPGPAIELSGGQAQWFSVKGSEADLGDVLDEVRRRFTEIRPEFVFSISTTFHWEGVGADSEKVVKMTVYYSD